MPRVIASGMHSIMVDDSSGTPRDIKSEVISIQFGDTNNLIDVTTIDEAEMKRIIGNHDSTATIDCFVNTDSNSTYDVFLANSSGSRTLKFGFTASLFWNSEQVIGESPVSRDTDGNMTMSVSMEQASGVTSPWTTS